MIIEARPTDIENLFVVLWGELKTLKTSFVLSASKPIVHIDLDQGIDRAAWRYIKNDPTFKLAKLQSPIDPEALSAVLTKANVVSIQYQMPMRWPGMPPKGFIDYFNAITNDLKVAYENPLVKTIAIDTDTQLWNAKTQAHLELVQEKPSERQRHNLIQIEYAQPNADMRAIHAATRLYKKNLITVHHTGGIYEDKIINNRKESVRVGNTWEGWSKIGTLADVVIRTTTPALDSMAIRNGQKPIPQMIIDTCGLTLDAQGITLPLDYNTLFNTINALRAM